MEKILQLNHRVFTQTVGGKEKPMKAFNIDYAKMPTPR